MDSLSGISSGLGAKMRARLLPSLDTTDFFFFFFFVFFFFGDQNRTKNAGEDRSMCEPVPESTLTSHSKRLLGLDEWWEIDATYLQWLLGSESGAGLRQAWLEQCTPSGGVLNLDAAIAASEVLKQTASQFALASTVAEIEVADQMLKNVRSGDKLLPSVSVGAWLSTVAVSLEQYVTFSEASTSSGAAASTAAGSGEMVEKLRGGEALYALLQHHKKHKPTSLEQLKWFSVFRHKFMGDELATVTRWRDDLLKSDVKPVAKAGSVRKCAKPKAQSDELRDAVRAALRLPSKRS